MMSIQGRIALLVERVTFNPKVVGSSLYMGVSFYNFLNFVIVKLSLKFLFGSDDTIRPAKVLHGLLKLI